MFAVRVVFNTFVLDFIGPVWVVEYVPKKSDCLVFSGLYLLVSQINANVPCGVSDLQDRQRAFTFSTR